jgi:hypothetical protein
MWKYLLLFALIFPDTHIWRIYRPMELPDNMPTRELTMHIYYATNLNTKIYEG